MSNITPTLPTKNTKSHGEPASPVSSRTTTATVAWYPEVGREERYRQLFRHEMRHAFIKQLAEKTAIDRRVDEIMSAIHSWCLSSAADILGCRVVLRGGHIDVLVFEPLREFTETFAAKISQLGIDLTRLGIHAQVLPISLEDGQNESDFHTGSNELAVAIKW